MGISLLLILAEIFFGDLKLGQSGTPTLGLGLIVLLQKSLVTFDLVGNTGNGITLEFGRNLIRGNCGFNLKWELF